MMKQINKCFIVLLLSACGSLWSADIERAEGQPAEQSSEQQPLQILAGSNSRAPQQKRSLCYKLQHDRLFIGTASFCVGFLVNEAIKRAS